MGGRRGAAEPGPEQPSGERGAGRATYSGERRSWPLRTFARHVLVAAQMPFAASWLVSMSCDMTSPTLLTVTRKCLWFPSLLNAGLNVRPVP